MSWKGTTILGLPALRFTWWFPQSLPRSWTRQRPPPDQTVPTNAWNIWLSWIFYMFPGPPIDIYWSKLSIPWFGTFFGTLKRCWPNPVDKPQTSNSWGPASESLQPMPTRREPCSSACRKSTNDQPTPTNRRWNMIFYFCITHSETLQFLAIS